MVSDDKTLGEVQRESHEAAKSYGFWGTPEQDSIPSKIALIHSEVSEMLEAWRDPDKAAGTVRVPAALLSRLIELARWSSLPDPSATVEDAMEVYLNWEKKPAGFASEVADAVIRLLDLAEHEGVDVDAEIERKQAYNRTRGKRWARI